MGYKFMLKIYEIYLTVLEGGFSNFPNQPSCHHDNSRKFEDFGLKFLWQFETMKDWIGIEFEQDRSIDSGMAAKINFDTFPNNLINF